MPSLPTPRALISIGLSLVAHLLCLWPGRAFFDLEVVALLVVYATALHAMAVMERPGRGARIARGIARFILTIVYVVSGYIAVLFSSAAGWATRRTRRYATVALGQRRRGPPNAAHGCEQPHTPAASFRLPRPALYSPPPPSGGTP